MKVKIQNKPYEGEKRTHKRFAFLPTKVNDSIGSETFVVWFRHYYEEMQYKKFTISVLYEEFDFRWVSVIKFI